MLNVQRLADMQKQLPGCRGHAPHPGNPSPGNAVAGRGGCAYAAVASIQVFDRRLVATAVQALRRPV